MPSIYRNHRPARIAGKGIGTHLSPFESADKEPFLGTRLKGRSKTTPKSIRIEKTSWQFTRRPRFNPFFLVIPLLLLIIATPIVVLLLKQESPGGAVVEPPPEPFSSWYFYDGTRAERYAAFSRSHPELTEEEVVWMVDCDLDERPFENVKEISNPSDPLVLINKHFRLPSSYVPSDLARVGETQMCAPAASALEQLISNAAREEMTIWASSGFRSYETQAALYEANAARDGAPQADRYSARAGFSEHQSGLAIDINGVDDNFVVPDAEREWLTQHAHQYGFIMRYTAENEAITGYMLEPWHLRYIGPTAAMKMHELGIGTYEEYWVKYVLYTPPAAS
jgi:D-alanyl-D-alanine carboxypeptidase